MKTIGIIAAMDSEMRALADRMQNREEHILADMPYYTGTLEGVPTVVCCCGVGKVNAGIHTQILIDRFKPDILIQNGVAGSLSADVEYFDLIVGSELVYHDMQTWVLEQFEPLQTVYTADPKLVQLAAEAAGECKIGRIATGDWFVSEPADKERIAKGTNALCVEMEGCAVAHTATLNRVPFVVLRAISDKADGGAHEDYVEFAQKAADRAVEILLRLLPTVAES
ncbi:MAG: 5'-methylthioadenosine/adenosylhomocysteine nucleosidase [Clostridia bacterium]|nr:5'-methylthioadenosine/adenosylhomocysteine nucleosidase [Clostridia bacterium]